MNKDPYEVLGLSPDATSEEVKKKYRTLVKQYHPDLHPDDAVAAEKMSEINAAYERINSGDVYSGDYYSHSSGNTSSAPSGSYTENGTTYYYRYSDMEDIFRTFFGSFGFGDNSYRTNTKEVFDRIEMYLNSGDYYRAAEILNKISIHDAKWNYYAARICEASGRISEAYSFAANAYRSEPDNHEYRQLFEEIEDVYSKEIGRRKRVRRFFSAAAIFMMIMMTMQIFRPFVYLLLS